MDDPKAFEELVIRYQGVVCAVAYSILRDRARSEEVAQEAFLIAWQKLPAITPAPQLPAWVCGIARNLARNAARRLKELPMHDSMTEPTTTADSPVELMLDRERHQLAERALDELGQADREAIVLYYRGDGSFADVAATLGITEAAARQRVHRGRERLKSALTAVETSLRATRPSHAFTAACVAALAAGGASTASAATTKPRVARAWIAAPIAAVLIGGGAAALSVSSSSSSSSDRSDTPVLASAVADARAVVADSAYFKRIDRADRTTRIDKLHAAQRTQQAAQPSADLVKTYDFSGDVLGPVKANVPPPDPSKLGKATLRYAIRDLQPLLLECYSDAFDRLPRKDGTLEVKLVLVGEPEVATLVDEVELGGDSHLTKDTAFVECMRETLFTIELPAMASAETWNVHYPFTMPGKP